MTVTLTDPVFPDLGAAIDAPSMLERIDARLRAADEPVTLIDGSIVDIQYTPGANCSVLYRLRLRSTESGRSTRQFLSVRLLQTNEAPRPVPSELLAQYARRRAHRATRRESPLRSPVLTFPGRHLAAYAYPVDPYMPFVLAAADPAAMRQGLGQIWGSRGVKVRDVAVETLSYRSHARAAILYHVLSEDRATGIPEMRRLVGKLHVRRTPDILFAGSYALWRAADGQVGMAPPVGYVTPAHVALQEYVPGIRLTDLPSPGSLVKHARQAARALAATHGLMLPCRSRRTAEKEALVIRRWAGILRVVRPDLTPRIDYLAGRLLGELASQVQVVAPVHGDFHPANVLVDRDQVTLIDWDQMALGDPMVDVGRFLGSLRVTALRIGGDPDGLAEVGDAFLDAYLTKAPGDVRRVRLFEALALLLAAGGPFRLQRPGWQEDAARLLDHVEPVLDRATAGTHVAVAAPPRHLALDVRVRWATDPTYAQAVLSAYLHDDEHSAVQFCGCQPTVLHRDDAGCHIRYALSGLRDGIGWERTVDGFLWAHHSARHVLERVERVRERLGDAADAALLPRPLGLARPLGMLLVEPCVSATQPTGAAPAASDTPPGAPPAVPSDLMRLLARVEALFSS